jgi:hypothetical protein
MIITYIKVAPQAYLRLGPHNRRRGREKKDKDIGYLKGNHNSYRRSESAYV